MLVAASQYPAELAPKLDGDWRLASRVDPGGIAQSRARTGEIGDGGCRLPTAITLAGCAVGGRGLGLSELPRWVLQLRFLAMAVLLRYVLGWLVGVFRTRADLILENLALRQQLLALQPSEAVAARHTMKRLLTRCATILRRSCGAGSSLAGSEL